MAQAFTPGLSVVGATRIRKRRELPLPGNIVTSVGQRVSASSVVARAELEGELRIVRAAETFGIPAESLERTLRIAPGSPVSQGDILAELKGLWGLFTTRVTSPISGTVEFISSSTGHIGVRAAPRHLDLGAYIAGEVVAIEGNRGVVIEACGAFIQGIFGVGGERHGTILPLEIDPSTRVTSTHIPSTCSGAVLVGGNNPSIDAIRAAATNGAVGFVTGSIDDLTLREYLGYDLGIALTGDEGIPMTIIVTEGFGSIPMSARVWNLVTSLSGRDCSLNGATQVRAGALRPELIVPHSESSATLTSPHTDDGSLVVGSRIRLIRVPYFGRLATVAELPHDPTKIDTGAVTRVLRAKLDSGEVVTVPRANVERI